MSICIQKKIFISNTRLTNFTICVSIKMKKKKRPVTLSNFLIKIKDRSRILDKYLVTA